MGTLRINGEGNQKKERRKHEEEEAKLEEEHSHVTRLSIP